METDLKQLNREAIAAAKRHMGGFAWPTVLLTAVVVGGYGLNLALVAAGALPLWLAAGLLAALTYMSYTPVHEAAHGNIHGNHARLKWLNDLCGYLGAQLILVPYSTHTVEHFTHHRHTNDPDKDPDFVVSGMGRGPAAFVAAAGRFLWTQITYLFHGHWDNMPRREKAVYVAELGVALGWRLALLAVLPLAAWLALLVGGYLAAVLFTIYWFAYRPHHPYRETARYRNTNSLIMPAWMKPLEWFWLGQNLHSIHHAFPRVPFYRYHALYREIEPILRAHEAPVIGIFDRVPVAG